MRIEQADASDRVTNRECFEIVRAADEIDDPLGPPWSLQRLRGWLEYPVYPTETWICRDETTGAARGWYYMLLPQRENRDRAYLYLDVHPSWRRRGIGTALLSHAAGRAAADGRSVVGSEAFQGSAGAAFATRVGATAGLVEARRVLVLGKIPAGRVAFLREQAARAAAGYSLVCWDGRTPAARRIRSGTRTGSGSRWTTSASGRAGTSTPWRRCTTRAGRLRRSPR